MLIFQSLDATGNNSVQKLSSNGLIYLREQNSLGSLPNTPFQSRGVWYFLQVTWTAAQHFLVGVGEEKLYCFPFEVDKSN